MVFDRQNFNSRWDNHSYYLRHAQEKEPDSMHWSPPRLEVSGECCFFFTSLFVWARGKCGSSITQYNVAASLSRLPNQTSPSMTLVYRVFDEGGVDEEREVVHSLSTGLQRPGKLSVFCSKRHLLAYIGSPYHPLTARTEQDVPAAQDTTRRSACFRCSRPCTW